MSRSSLSLMCSLVVFLPLAAEIVNKTTEELKKTATHIVTGEVTAIYERIETGSHWKTTYYVAEIKISTAEKGEGLARDQLVYARYWHREWISAEQIPPSTTGYRNLPGRGDNVRAYLAKNAYDGFDPGNKDGGYNVVSPNGFEILKGLK